MKTIGIITFHSAHNYGSVFQAYAMLRIMQKLGLSAKIIDYRHPMTTAMYEYVGWNKDFSIKQNLSNLWYKGICRDGRERARIFNDFITNNMCLTERVNNPKAIKEEFDYLVCGSDQIWNPLASGRNDPVYYLDFGNKDSIRFSYAASSGSYPFADGREKEIRTYLEAMKLIGVRETYMKEYIRKKLNLDSQVNPDPTVLLKKEDWEQIEEKHPSINEEKKYILVYTLSKMGDTIKFAKQVGAKYDLPVIHINHLIGKSCNVEGIQSLKNVTPGQFLWLYHHASFVVSNTFHGNMFSIIYRKPFVWYCTSDTDSRIQTLHDAVGLFDSRKVRGIDEIEKTDIINLDYSIIEDKIEQFREKGISFIKNCIEE